MLEASGRAIKHTGPLALIDVEILLQENDALFQQKASVDLLIDFKYWFWQLRQVGLVSGDQVVKPGHVPADQWVRAGT